MSEFQNALSVTASGLQAQVRRLRHVSENIANADTPGYRRKTVPFREVFGNRDVPRQVTTDVKPTAG